MTEFASAIADLRLSGEKLNQDANTVRSQLLRLTQQLEEAATIQLSLGIDVRRAQRDLQRAVSAFSVAGAFNVPVGLDTDQALDDLATLTTFDDPISVPVVADTDEAVDDISALIELTALEPASLRINVDDTDAAFALQQLEQTSLPRVEQAFGEAGENAGLAFAQQLQQTVFNAVGSFSIALGAFTATSLFRGFQRLSTIEDATASLTVALDSATASARVLDDVLDVVTGTPFNLDQFANAAANLISFGVEAEKVPVYLDAIAEASASRGGRANEFAQRLATTFGQISVQGRITGEDILSLQATGVDALRILGNAFGETTIDIRELISEGVIPAEEALDILADGIQNGTDGINGATVAFAGTAERLRETLTGAIGGFESATARLGASIIGPFTDALTTGFNSATDIVNQFTTQFDVLFSDVANSDAFEAFVAGIERLPDLIDPFIEALADFGPALAPLAAGFGALGINQLSGLLGNLGLVIPGINGVTAAIVALVAATPELREAVVPILGDLGEALAVLGAGLGEALGDAIEAIVPLLAEFIEALGDLTPFVSDIAVFTVALANGLVPVLEALSTVLEFFPVEVLAAIGGGLLAFRGIQAAAAPIRALTDNLAGFGAQLQLAEADAERFGSRFTDAAQRVGVSGETITRTARGLTTALNTAAAAGAGFFSGFALGADDATTQALGFAGAITSIGTAYATGGLPGGLLATATTIGGVFVQQWTEAKRAAEEYQRFVNDVAQDVIDDLGAATAALLEARDLINEEPVEEQALATISQEELDLLTSYGVEVDRIFDAAAQDPQLGRNLADDIERAKAAAQEATTAFVVDSAEPGLGGGFAVSAEEAAEFYAQELEKNLQPAIDDIEGVDLSPLIQDLDARGTVDSIGVFDIIDSGTEGLDLAAEKLQTTGDLVVDVEEQIDELNQRDLVRIAGRVRDFADDFGLTTEQVTALRDEIDEVGLDSTRVSQAFSAARENVDAFLEAEDELAQFGITPFDLIVNGITDVEEEFGVLIEITDDGTLEITKDLEDVADGADQVAVSTEQAAAALEAAFKVADEAAKEFSRTLQEQLSILDEIAANQDFARGFRDFGETFSEIINQDDLDQAQRLIEDIGDTRGGIADLQAQLAREQADANIELEILNRRIADAQAAGAVEGAAALILERDRVFDDVNETQREIEDQIRKVQELEAEVAQLSQAPITLGELLRGQAAERGLSLFELLITAPTNESQEFFQSQITGQIQQAGVLIQQAVDENPIAASLEIPSIVEDLVFGFVQGGLDEETARALVSEVLQPDVLAQTAAEQFVAEFQADVAELNSITASLLAGEEIDPSIDINAEVEDVGDGIARLAELEELGIDIPAGIDLLAAQTALTDFETAYDESDFELIIPVAGDLSEIESQITGLEEYTIQLTAQRRASQQDIIDRSATEGTGSSAGERWWERDFSVPLPGFGVNRPFLDGGFYNFKDGSENHVAQIAQGAVPFRVWAEPETGGEAYIPLGNSKRSRSTQILTSVADLFGMDLVPRGRGAAAAARTALDEGSMARAVETGVRAARSLPSPGARAAAHDRAARSVNVEKIEVSGVRDPNKAVRKMIRSLSDVAMGMTDWDEWDD